jgi:hypothetical protein
MPRRFPDGPASGEFIAQRNIRFSLDPLFGHCVTKKFKLETRLKAERYAKEIHHHSQTAQAVFSFASFA